MNFKKLISGLFFLEFIGVLLVAVGIFGIRFYGTRIEDSVLSITSIIIGAVLIIYSNFKRRR